MGFFDFLKKSKEPPPILPIYCEDTVKKEEKWKIGKTLKTLLGVVGGTVGAFYGGSKLLYSNSDTQERDLQVFGLDDAAAAAVGGLDIFKRVNLLKKLAGMTDGTRDRIELMVSSVYGTTTEPATQKWWSKGGWDWTLHVGGKITYNVVFYFYDNWPSIRVYSRDSFDKNFVRVFYITGNSTAQFGKQQGKKNTDNVVYLKELRNEKGECAFLKLNFGGFLSLGKHMQRQHAFKMAWGIAKNEKRKAATEAKIEKCFQRGKTNTQKNTHPNYGHFLPSKGNGFGALPPADATKEYLALPTAAQGEEGDNS